MAYPFPYIEVKGTNYEIGLAIGEQLRDKLKEYNERLKVIYSKSAKHSKHNLEEIAKRTGKLIGKHFPRYYKELQGMSIGSKLSINDIILLCDEETLLEMIKHKCTTVAYSCKDGVFLGHNEDWIPGYEDNLYIIKGTPEKGAAFISLAYIGALPGSSVALNSYGIAFSGNSMLSGYQKGLPKNIILRSQIEAKTIKEFEKLAAFSPRAISNHTMAVDKKGNIISVELALDQYKAVHTSKSFVHTNHPLHEGLIELELGPKENSVIRYNTTLEYTLKGKLTKNLIKKILRSHENEPNSICVHPRNGDSSKAQTVASVIVNVKDMSMLIAKGNPCKSKYKKYCL